VLSLERKEVSPQSGIKTWEHGGDHRDGFAEVSILYGKVLGGSQGCEFGSTACPLLKTQRREGRARRGREDNMAGLAA
jgi:hypothetical protein